MSDLNTVYREMKFWLPMISAMGIVWKARTAITGWADRLMNNHLHSIQESTKSTEIETKRTNDLLVKSASDMVMLQNTIAEHAEKSAQVWNGILNTLAVLEDRTHGRYVSKAKRKAANATR